MSSRPCHRVIALALWIALPLGACGGDPAAVPPLASSAVATPTTASATPSSATRAPSASAGSDPGQTGAAGVGSPPARAQMGSSAAGVPVAGGAGAAAIASPASAAGAAAPAQQGGAGVAGSGNAPSAGQAAASVTDSGGSAQALTQLDAYLAMPRASRPELATQSFAMQALTRDDAQTAKQRLWEDYAQWIKDTREEEVGATENQERTIRVEGNDKVLRYYMARRGQKPATGWSLFISMHGGGNTTASTNDSQWRNQIDLVDGYDPKDALWVAPRAPIDDWNMWFIQEIDALFERLITDLIVFEGVDPNRVYINGYSAGGDGVYQLGPRMGERWAGAGMSAGHPNASSPLSLRNLAFAIHVGGDDTAYDRNKKAEEWGKRLEMLAAEDPGGYVNQWQVHAGKPHWMDLEDAVSIPFLQAHTRDPIPDKVVWEQAEYPRAHFYWLAVDESNRAKGALLRAHYDNEGIHITEAQDVERLSVLLNDDMLDLDAPVRVEFMGHQLVDMPVRRSIAVLQRTLQERGDPAMVFSAEITLDLP